MKIAALVGLFLALGGFPSQAKTVPYPHDSSRPGYCLDCHTEEVYRGNCDDPSGFCLLDGTVDGLCLHCHVREDCCRVGQEHQAKLFLGQKSHGSDVEVGRVRVGYRPRTLPVHKDKITCRTCHLHTKAATGDYKMLRIVQRNGENVDWSVLCRDCHEKNY